MVNTKFALTSRLIPERIAHDLETNLPYRSDLSSFRHEIGHVRLLDHKHREVTPLERSGEKVGLYRLVPVAPAIGCNPGGLSVVHVTLG